jgi:hypothetical protein
MSDRLPSSDLLFESVVECLRKNKGPMHIDLIEKYVRTELSISDDLAKEIRTGKRTQLAYKLAWARSKAKTEGLIVSPRHSYWQIATP